MSNRKSNFVAIYCSLLLIFGGGLIGISLSTKGVQFGLNGMIPDYNLRLYTESSNTTYFSGIETNNTINGLSQLSLNVIEPSSTDLMLEITYIIDNLVKGDLIKLDLILFGLFTDNTVIKCFVNQREHLLHGGVNQILQENGKVNLLNFNSELNDGFNEIIITIENTESISPKSFVVTTFIENAIREDSIVPVYNNVLSFDYLKKEGYHSENIFIQMPFSNVQVVLISLPDNDVIVDEQVLSNYYQVVLEDGSYQVGFYEVD
jgi:hypothetical protein